MKSSRTSVCSSNKGAGAGVDYSGLTGVEFQCGYDIPTKTGRMQEEFGENGTGKFDGGILWLLELWNRMTGGPPPLIESPP